MKSGESPKTNKSCAAVSAFALAPGRASCAACQPVTPACLSDSSSSLARRAYFSFPSLSFFKAQGSPGITAMLSPNARTRRRWQPPAGGPAGGWPLKKKARRTSHNKNLAKCLGFCLLLQR